MRNLELDDADAERLKTVYAYHDRTKHDFHHSAASLGYLDWANQPDPFRRYAGARLFRLPLLAIDGLPLYDEVYRNRTPARPLNVVTLSKFLECSMGLSAWKSYEGEGWALRCNPSSGNLHPTECYVVTGPITDLSTEGGVYHYAPAEHGLEEQGHFNASQWAALRTPFLKGTFFVGLTSILWREIWKYGERAFRYCQHDVGHAVAALTYAGAMLGWDVVMLDGMSDASVAAVLGIDRAADFDDAELEHPETLLAVMPFESTVSVPWIIETAFVASNWRGAANRLSDDHVDWPIIDLVARDTEKFDESRPSIVIKDRRERVTLTHRSPKTLDVIAQQRRSAVSMDGQTAISRGAFYTMLARTLPVQGGLFDAVSHSRAYVHLALFVHRVDDLPSGLYVLIRDEAFGQVVRAAMKTDFRWSTPEGCPDELPLYHLQSGNAQSAAAQLSCVQAIAGDGAFTLGMLVEFDRALNDHGPHYYRRLFWETGIVGQTLYLESEAGKVRATGIGCFFDDPVHAAFGIDGKILQSLYHFTVGGPVEDKGAVDFLDAALFALAAFGGVAADVVRELFDLFHMETVGQALAPHRPLRRFHQPRQGPETVPQQRRIRRIMNGRFQRRRIHADLLGANQLRAPRILAQGAVHGLPRLRRYSAIGLA
jgi:SagB-type dehydrogenase family enzyme